MSRKTINEKDLSTAQGGALDALWYGEGDYRFTYSRGNFETDCEYLVNYERTYPGILKAFKERVDADAKSKTGNPENIGYGQRVIAAAEEHLNLIKLQEKTVF